MKIYSDKSSQLRDEKLIENRKVCEWLNSKEAANFLCISEGALRTLVYRGQIPFYKFGRRLRFRFSDVRSLFQKKGA